jgi:four helix bundle protein
VASEQGEQASKAWAGESPLFTRTFDLLLWLTGRVSNFPKAHRFRLAQRIEDAAFGFHEQLLQATRAGSPKAKMRLLLKADVELDKLRFYLRMAAEPTLKLITPRQYEHASRMIVEVGKLLGGWIKKVKAGKA